MPTTELHRSSFTDLSNVLHNRNKLRHRTSSYQYLRILHGVSSWRYVAPTIIALFFLVGLLHYFGGDCYKIRSYEESKGDDGGDWLSREGGKILRGMKPWGGLQTLIIVAGHAVYTGERLSNVGDVMDEKNWVLESYQVGQVPSFVQHIRRGLLEIVNDTEALLVFSGGVTRTDAGLISEGESYWRVARVIGKEVGIWNRVKERCVSEEFARDSWENLLFSVCRFRQIVGKYPEFVKVISFEFKRRRFIDLHRKALRFPKSRFRFVGIDPDTKESKKGIGAGEQLQAFGPYTGDLYGCRSKILRDKKMKRNPFIRFHPYPQGCPNIAPLFRFCGRTVYRGKLPWDIRYADSKFKRSENDVKTRV